MSLTTEQHLARVLNTILQNEGAGFNPYMRPGVQDAIVHLNEAVKPKAGLKWGDDAWKELLTPRVSCDSERKLYTIRDGHGVSCLGFDNAYRRALMVADELGKPGLRPLARNFGTIEGYAEYERVMDTGHASGRTFKCGLHPQLVGYEGKRVEVGPSNLNEPKRRFIVGRSTGWLPCHIARARKDSTGGGGILLAETFAYVREV